MRTSRRHFVACTVVAGLSIAGCTAESSDGPSDEQSNLILEYEIGHDHHTNGLDWFSEAFRSYENGEFEQAQADFDSAAEEFSLASDSFQSVLNGLVDHGTDSAADVNGDASEAAAKAGSEAGSCSTAALTMPDSNAEDIIERVKSDYQQGIFDIPQVSEFEATLSS